MESLISAARRLRFVQRCTAYPCLKPINDAEHSFGVGVIMDALVQEQLTNAADEFTALDAYRCLRNALYHDMHESIVGDVLYTVKRASKSLRRELEELEARTNQYLGLDLRSSVPTGDMMLKASDMAELLCYLTEERELGNANSFITACWYFCLTQVYKFQLFLNSEVLERILHWAVKQNDDFKDNFFDGLAAWLFPGGTTVKPLWFWPADATELIDYHGFRVLYPGQKAPANHEKVIQLIEKCKSITWAMPMESRGTDASQFMVCRSMHIEKYIVPLPHPGPFKTSGPDLSLLQGIANTHGYQLLTVAELSHKAHNKHCLV